MENEILINMGTGILIGADMFSNMAVALGYMSYEAETEKQYNNFLLAADNAAKMTTLCRIGYTYLGYAQEKNIVNDRIISHVGMATKNNIDGLFQVPVRGAKEVSPKPGQFINSVAEYMTQASSIVNQMKIHQKKYPELQLPNLSPNICFCVVAGGYLAEHLEILLENKDSKEAERFKHRAVFGETQYLFTTEERFDPHMQGVIETRKKIVESFYEFNSISPHARIIAEEYGMNEDDPLIDWAKEKHYTSKGQILN